jgi:hypothetical protein
MSRRRKPVGEGEVVGGTPPTASSVRVTLIATCKIDGVRRLPGEVLEIDAALLPAWREKRIIEDPDHPPPSEFAWLSQP